ncbi:MAG: DNA-directed RNA polymerase subunit omega [Deltaproteobacteria bacterium]|nr:DNA-directed RNA polymerase subunit omega [Deltaproteobacteria bacterium]
MRRLFSSQDLDKVTTNRYEAVIVTSRRARHLNTMRLAALQRLESDPDIEIDTRKITGIALNDFIEGKVTYTKPDKK